MTTDNLVCIIKLLVERFRGGFCIKSWGEDEDQTGHWGKPHIGDTTMYVREYR